MEVCVRFCHVFVRYSVSDFFRTASYLLREGKWGASYRSGKTLSTRCEYFIYDSIPCGFLTRYYDTTATGQRVFWLTRRDCADQIAQSSSRSRQDFAYWYRDGSVNMRSELIGITPSPHLGIFYPHRVTLFRVRQWSQARFTKDDWIQTLDPICSQDFLESI